MGFAAHENDRDAFEMQPLNYEDLSEEAKQLIQQHVPGAGASNLDHSQQSSAALALKSLLVKVQTSIYSMKSQTIMKTTNNQLQWNHHRRRHLQEKTRS